MEDNSNIPSLKTRLEYEVYKGEDEFNIMTERHHMMKGECCGSTCKHCPYWPKYQKGNVNLNMKVKEMMKDMYGTREDL